MHLATSMLAASLVTTVTSLGLGALTR